MKIFLSAVSTQFKTCRDALASDLRAIGCEVKVQEDFQQGPESLIGQIENYIHQCDKVIAIVGDAYGADAASDAIPVGKPARSYTQWEYFFACGERLRGSTIQSKDLYVYVASTNYLSNNPVAQSDEHRARQQQFIQEIKHSGKHRSNFDTLDQLCRLVLRDGWHMNHRPIVFKPPLQLPKRAFAQEFFGRKSLLAEIVERLKRRENIDIWGPAGMGKTALAAEAIYQVLGNGVLARSPFPDGVVLVDLYALKFSSPDPAWHHLANAFDESIPTTQSARDRAQQSCANRKVLVVIEGAEEASDGATLQDFLSVLPPSITRFVLTRNKEQVSTHRPLNVKDELERDDALDLLRKLWDKNHDESIIESVYDKLGGHPLALTWAGSQLANNDESPTAFLKSLEEIHAPGNAQHNLEWLFKRSVKHLSPAAQRVLQGFGLLAQLAIPFSAACALLPDAPEKEIREALKQLVRYGLLRIEGEDLWVFTHALTHQFAHRQSDEAMLAPLGDWAKSALNTATEQAKRVGDFSLLQRNLSHAAALLQVDNSAQYLHDLAKYLRYDAYAVFTALGRLELVRAALVADQHWLQQAPKSIQESLLWQRECSVSHNNLGDVAMAVGDLEAARTAYEDGLEIAKRLAAADPSNSEWQRDLSVSHEMLGNVAMAAGDLEAARTAYEEYQKIAKRLGAADPSNSQWQRDLSVSHNKLGDVAMAAGDLAVARMAYEDGLKICKRLAAADPSNSEWQRDLSVSHDRLGDVAMAAGDLAAARMAYEDGLKIRKRLAVADPSNSQWQRDLLVSFAKIAGLLLRENKSAEALKFFKEAQAIAERLVKLDNSNAIWRNDLAWANEQIAALDQ